MTNVQRPREGIWINGRRMTPKLSVGRTNLIRFSVIEATNEAMVKKAPFDWLHRRCFSWRGSVNRVVSG